MTRFAFRFAIAFAAVTATAAVSLIASFLFMYGLSHIAPAWVGLLAILVACAAWLMWLEGRT